MATDITPETAPAVKRRASALNPGVYRITNTNDGKIYVGSSRYLRHRLSAHRWKLRRGDHDNIILQRAWNRDGETAFRFDIVERCAVDELLIREQAWINQLKSRSDQDGYNLCPVAGTIAGLVMPESHRVAARARFLGIPKSPEHRARIGSAQKGKVISREQRDRARETTKAYFSDPENRRKASEKAKGRPSKQKGKPLSPETILKLKASHKARWDGVERKKRKSYYKSVPKEQRRKTGPAKGTPRPDRRRLNGDQIRQIRNAFDAGESMSSLSRRFEHDRCSIQRICRREAYTDIV